MGEENQTQIVGCAKRANDGALLLMCYVKRTYRIAPGRCSVADEQVPLTMEPLLQLDAAGSMRALLDDTDLVAPKVATDVILEGTAYHSTPVRQFGIGIAIDDITRQLHVQGPRRIGIQGQDVVRFSQPELVTSVALVRELAYGGYDDVAQRTLRTPDQYLINRHEPALRGLFECPRNGSGCGYYIDVNRARADGMPLPQIEDPADLLTPERLFLAQPTAWINAPIPGLLGWIAYADYPRIARYLGPVLEHDAVVDVIRETTFADGRDLDGIHKPTDGQIHPRALQGAAPGMACKRLRGNEPIVLLNLHPTHPRLSFNLPAERPRFSLHPSGISKDFHPEAILQTLRIESDKERFSLTWCGAVRLAKQVDEEFVENTRLDVKWSKI